MKRYIALAVVGLVVGYLAQSNYLFQDERDVYFPITKEQLQTKVRFAKIEQAQAEQLNAPDLLAAIYNQKVLTRDFNQKDYFKKIETYFTAHQSYSTRSTPQKNALELKHKLSFLIAFSTNWNTPQKISGFEPQEYAQFLKSLAQNKNEHILVRKQAYKNWLSFTQEAVAVNARTAAEKVRLAQLVTFSDAQMIDSLSQNEN